MRRRSSRASASRRRRASRSPATGRRRSASAIAAEAVSEGLRPNTASGRRRFSWAWVATVPFFAYTIAFLFLPAGSILLGAFEGKESGWTIANVQLLFHHPYIDAYKTSIEISLVTALAGGIAGLFIAYAALREGTPRWVRSGLTRSSGVAATFHGTQLAFAFIATVGPLARVTVLFR